MKRSEKKRAERSRGHRLLSRRRTHQPEESNPPGRREPSATDEPRRPERGFVIGPVDGGSSDISLD